MRTFLLIPALFLASSLFSQKTFLEYVHVATMGDNIVNSVIEVKDGFIGTCYSYEYINSNEPFMSLCKIDFNGQFIWGKMTSCRDGKAIVKTHDSGFAIAGELVDGSGVYQICVLKFDANGLLQWTKQYNEGPGSTAWKLLETDDNGFLIAGEIDLAPYTSLGYLIKTDSIGNLKWSKKFPDISRVADLKKTTDNNYILLANNINNIIIKIDTAGNILWSKTFMGPVNQRYYTSHTILSVTDGGYLITGYEEFYGDDAVYGFIFRLDSLGNVLWSKLVDAGYLELYNAIETTKKDFILTGIRIARDSNYNYNYYHYFIKVSSSGALVWTKELPSAGPQEYVFDDYINDLIATSDSGYLGVCTGSYLRPNFIKFDSAFNTCEPTQTLGSMKDFTVSYSNTTISNVAGNAVTYTNPVTISSEGYVDNICSVLPVTLAAFNASLQKKSVLVQWQTATETNTSYFNIQRSTNGINFSDIARLTATGNSNSAHDYSYSDWNIAESTSAKTVYYRLQSVDNDGSSALSKIVPVKMNTKTTALLLLPNPVKDKLSARITNYSGNADVRIYDVAGKQVYTKTAAADNADIIISTVTLKAGTYLLQITAGELLLTQKFVKE